MKNVNTVTGPVSVNSLGKTLMHEHLVSSCAGIADNYPEINKHAYETVMSDMNDMKKNGIKTVVEATAFDLGRDEKMLKRCAETSGMNVIACTGFFKEPDPGMGVFSKNRLAELFIREINEGIKDTKIKPGIFKTAMDTEGATPGRELTHRVAGIVSKELHFPVMLHSCPEKEVGKWQIKFLKEEGAELFRVKIDHCLETMDMNYIKWLYDQGVWLGIDRLPRVCVTPEEYSQFPSIDTRVDTIKKMIDAGMSDRMLFSHDFISVSSYFDHLPNIESQQYVNSFNPLRFSFLQQVIFYKLEEKGIPRTLLETMLEDNPRRFFAGC